MGSEMNQAARCTGPVSAADATWRTGVNRVALTGSAQSEVLPTTGKADTKKVASTIAQRWVRVLAMGANVQLGLGRGSAPTIALNAVSTGGPPKAPLATAGATYINGLPDQFMIDSEVTHIGFIGDAGAAGFLEWYVSDQPFV